MQLFSDTWTPHPPPTHPRLQIAQRKAEAAKTAVNAPASGIQYLGCRDGSARYLAGYGHRLRSGQQ